MERGRLRTRCHHASILPRSAHAQVFGLGAKRTAARGYVIQDDAGSEENRAAGGPGPEPPILSERSLDGRGSTTIYNGHRWGPQAECHEPPVVRPELGLGWPESEHRWTWTTCRAASLGCSE